MNPQFPRPDLPPPGDPSLRGGQDTFASNPACLKLSAIHWLAANPSAIYVALGMAVAGIVVVFIKLPVGVVLLLSAVFFLFREVREARQKFYMGDVCPGVVLSAQENLVAVYTDLVAAGDRPYPVIQILKQPLNRMTTERAYDGMRVATAALYLGNVKDAAWKNFWPEVINCVIHDPPEINRVLSSIPEEEWQLLDACLARLPDRKPGLHHIGNLYEANGDGGGFAGTVPSVPPRPWFKSPAAIFAFVAFGLVAVMFLFLGIAAFVAQKMNHREPPIPRPGLATPMSRPTMPPMTRPQPAMPPPQFVSNAPPFAAPTQTGPYAVGSVVEANWAGGWIPGKITRINPGGFSVFVQLDDPRFPQPIVLGTNQLRLK